MLHSNIEKVICALDVQDADVALKYIDKTASHLVIYKIGLKLFTQQGPAIVRAIKAKGKKVFLDLKFHDIPNTVADAVEEACALDVDFLTLHTWGGLEMLARASLRAQEWCKKHNKVKPSLLGVTVLTSMDELSHLQIEHSVESQVHFLAGLAKQAKLDGIVCSPHEIAGIKHNYPELKIVCPGIRPPGSEKGDQKRVMTPQEALDLGADYLVIGRPLLQAADPQTLLEQLFI